MVEPITPLGWDGSGVVSARRGGWISYYTRRQVQAAEVLYLSPNFKASSCSAKSAITAAVAAE